MSDAYADGGVRLVAGDGLIRLGQWAAERHDKYVALMRRFQKFIATMTIAEKEERKGTSL